MERINDEDLHSEIDLFIQEWKDTTLDHITAHTSGSTGTPKNIRLPKNLVRHSALRSVDFFEITPESRLHLPLSPNYIAGKMLIVRTMVANCILTFESPSQSPLAHNSDPRPIQLLPIVGSQLPGLIDSYNSGKLPHIEHLLIGGAPLNASMRTLATSGSWKAWESYGMTETASHIALRRITLNNSLPFHTLPGISVSLNSDNCLVIDLGSDGTVVTNDVAEVLSNTEFHILGRKDHAIITAGHKVFPEQIEQILAKVLKNRKFYITSTPSPKWGEEIALIIEGEPFEIPDWHTLGLKSYQIPRHTMFVPHIRLTESGKIIRDSIKSENQKR